MTSSYREEHMTPRTSWGAGAAVLGLLAVLTSPAIAQQSADPGFPKFQAGQQGSRNMHIVAHIPMGGRLANSDVEIEQELSRPYVYLSRMHSQRNAGFDIISI